MLPHKNIVTETGIKANVPMGELDTLCNVDNALQEGAARSNNLISKLKGANQRLQLL